MSIINGSFDTDISGWTPSGNGDYDIIWDTGRARLRVYRCSNAYLEQTFTIDANTISFDWKTTVENRCSEIVSWLLIIDGVTIINEGLGYGCGTPEFSGTKTVDTTAYIGQTATIKFFITESSPWCNNSDHANTYLYIDNVQLSDYLGITATNIVPSTTNCQSLCDATIDVTWTNEGTIARSFYPAITINTTTRIPLAMPEVPTSIDPGLSTTKSFIISGLIEGSYTICPDPN
jgi:hypothetical protein